jgi:hypothetical protein
VDDATIKAMRAVIGCLEKREAMAERGNHEYVAIGCSDIPAGAFSLAIDGLRELVDNAAAEQDSGDDGVRMVRYVVESLRCAYRSAVLRGGDVLIEGGGFSGAMGPKDAAVAVRAINGLLNAKQETPATNAEPTLEECVAAINRNKHKGSDKWELVVKRYIYLTGVQTLDEDETRGLGRLLIDRERAAKGGV